MDACCATLKSNAHFMQVKRDGFVGNGETGFLGERIKGSVRSRVWGSKFGKGLKAECDVRRANGVISSVLTSDVNQEPLIRQAPVFPKQKADPKRVTAIILGGGAGTRLFPLTSRRAKPAVLAATQTPGETGHHWFQGTADAVRQFTWVFEDAKSKNTDHILILSGDHLYRMDYMNFVQKHIDTNADITVSCIPMDDRYYLGLFTSLFEQPPKFQFYDPSTPFFTSPRFLPPTKVEKCRILDSIISHGCFLRECSVEHSIVGVRSRLEYGCDLKDTMMMGADNYQTESEIASLLAEGKVPIGVGQNTKIRNCIIDKNAKIGKDVVITNKDDVQEADRGLEGFYIRSGIIVILKNATIVDGTVI
ncbi:hypothetical protein IFM89_021133 [Coptis chinensis]|uniref:glucose-1-phosphate adenylyltransferase n=1 Tax=Coptis chinensis TaxID=261450 RepID=A0A835LWJ7_9MAGN|nr:hypothetical protein IFM89_021133 [Coptis chinensis]